MTKDIKYAAIRFFMKTVGRLSDGIRLCYQEGLTSGKMLDYIYRNQPSGRLIIGKMIDRRFLSDPGWQAVRTRRKNLERLIVQTIQEYREQGRPVSLIDIASGPGAYIQAVLQEVGEEGVTALCRDFEPRWVEEGRRAAAQNNLRHIRYEQGDAFDRRQFQGLDPRPNLAVASGFYDWFNDDEQVRESMRIVFDCLEPDGYFVLSNQCNHPDLEFTEQVFTDFTNQPLRMTMRPTERVHALLREVGFAVVETLADAQNYYSVTRAQKPSTR